MWRHDQVEKALHYKLCERRELNRSNTWYEHKPQGVAESETNKLFWALLIETDHVLKHNRADLVVVDKVQHRCYVLNVACPFELRIVEKKNVKIDRYS